MNTKTESLSRNGGDQHSTTCPVPQGGTERSAINTQPTLKVFFKGPQFPDTQHSTLNTQHSTLNHLSGPPEWLVYVGDENAEPTGKIYTFGNYRWARDGAHAIANDRRLELIDQASPV